MNQCGLRTRSFGIWRNWLEMQIRKPNPWPAESETEGRDQQSAF